MPDAAENRLTASLTMCRKAGKLILGFDAVKEAAAHGDVKLILLASDVSAKTEKETRFFAGEIPIRKMSLDMDALKLYFRKRTAVFGICEDGFAAKLTGYKIDIKPEFPAPEPDSDHVDAEGYEILEDAAELDSLDGGSDEAGAV